MLLGFSVKGFGPTVQSKDSGLYKVVGSYRKLLRLYRDDVMFHKILGCYPLRPPIVDNPTEKTRTLKLGTLYNPKGPST